MAKTLKKSYFIKNNIIHSAEDCTPYTYLIGWKELNVWYYGVRYGKGVHPHDFWVTYKTSSASVANFISEHGDPDIKEVRRVFKSKLDARNWEDKVITRIRALSQSNWLNRSNNGSFKGIVMDDEIRAAISKARSSSDIEKKQLINNGTIQKFIPLSEQIPEGWVKGITDARREAWRITAKETAANRTPESLILSGEKASKKLKGVPKPAGHGANVSKATKGVPKPWLRGENNVSKRPEVKEKISKSWETRVLGVWYTNEIENFYIKEGNVIDDSWRRGVKHYERTYTSVKGRKWYNNGVISRTLFPDKKPEGWVEGRIISEEGKKNIKIAASKPKTEEHKQNLSNAKRKRNDL